MAKKEKFSLKLGIEAKTPEAAEKLIRAISQILNPAELKKFVDRGLKEIRRVQRKERKLLAK